MLRYVRRTKRAQTASRKAKRDITMLADFCGFLIGLKCYDFSVQLFYPKQP